MTAWEKTELYRGLRKQFATVYADTNEGPVRMLGLAPGTSDKVHVIPVSVASGQQHANTRTISIADLDNLRPYQWSRFDQITLTILKGWIEDEQGQIEDEQRKLSAKYADNKGRLRRIEKKLNN